MRRSWSFGVALVVASALGAFVLDRVSGNPPASNGVRAAPTGAEVRGLVLAVPFELQVPYVHAWRAEQPGVSTGWLVVLDVDPEQVRVTELAQPVLCAGDQTLERYNHGYESGRVVALLPAANATSARGATWLAAQPFFFASPQLPEQIDALAIGEERISAEKRGCAPFAAPLVERALARGGAPIVVHDRQELDRLAAQLILTHSPADRYKADELLR